MSRARRIIEWIIDIARRFESLRYMKKLRPRSHGPNRPSNRFPKERAGDDWGVAVGNTERVLRAARTDHTASGGDAARAGRHPRPLRQTHETQPVPMLCQ
jgi:hypothetical protein